MANKINRDARIEQIQTQIEQCKAYQQLDPDPSIIDRVSRLEKNPCLEGLYYLNASYKEFQYERSADAAIKYRETIWENIPYTSTKYSINGYIIKSQGFWKKEKLEGPFLSIAELDKRAAELMTEGMIPETDFTEYIDTMPMLTKISADKFSEYNPTQNIGEQRIPIKYKVFSVSLDKFFQPYFIPTFSILSTLENPTLLERIAGVPKVDVLFNWSKWKLYKSAQEKIQKSKIQTADINNEDTLSVTPDYISGWRVGVTIGPETVDNYYKFKSLSKNSLKANLEKEKEEIEAKYPKVPVYKTDLEGNVIEPITIIGERWPDNWPYVNLYIDTIDYNEWQKKIDDLNVLATKYSQLPAEIEPSEKNVPKKDDGTDYEPLCDKHYPLDMSKIFGLNIGLIPSLLKVDELLFKPDGSPLITYRMVNGEMVGRQERISHPVSVSDGYAYVSNGISVRLQYTGVPVSKNAVLVPGAGPEYGAVLGGYYKPATPDDKENIKKFPYQNDKKDGKYFWLQVSELSIDDFNNVSNIGAEDAEPIYVKFEIYVKYKLDCGFPKKCGKLTPDELNTNGVCGLQKFLSTPLVIDRKGLDKSLQNENYENVKIEVSNWKKTLNKTLSDAWDNTKNVAINAYNKTATMDNFMDVATEMFPAMEFIPKDCAKVLCESQREVKNKDSIDTLSDSLKNNVDSTELLSKNMIKSTEDAASKTVDGIGEFGSLAKQGLSNLVDTFNIYQLCSRRYKDWLMDAAVTSGQVSGAPSGVDVFTQLQKKFSTGIVDNFMGLLNNCVTNNLIERSISTSKDIFADQKKQIIGSFKSGNLTEFNNAINGSGLKDQFVNKATNTVSLIGTMNTPEFNMAKFNSIGQNFTRKLNTLTDVKNASDTFNFIRKVRDSGYTIDSSIAEMNDELKSLGVK